MKNARFSLLIVLTLILGIAQVNAHSLSSTSTSSVANSGDFLLTINGTAMTVATSCSPSLVPIEVQIFDANGTLTFSQTTSSTSLILISGINYHAGGVIDGIDHRASGVIDGIDHRASAGSGVIDGIDHRVVVTQGTTVLHDTIL